MSLNAGTVIRVRELVAIGERGEPVDLLFALQRVLAKWRSELIANTIRVRDGDGVQSGPFKGMRYSVKATEGAMAARLLGTYEAELHGPIQRMIADGLDTIVDIGCAEGYYAVGFALASPESLVEAFDIDAGAREKCRRLAQDNGVADRVRVREAFDGGRFADYGERTLVFLDAEGFEDELLKPSLYPGLKRLSVVVETHPRLRPGITERLIERFSPTHEVTIVRETLKPVPPGSWLETMPLSDQFHATWEWRVAPTPWLVMSPKTNAAAG